MYFWVCVCLCLKQVEEALEGVKNATNEQDLANRFKEFGKEMVKLNYVAARRQQVTERSFHPPCISSEGNKKRPDGTFTILFTISSGFTS